MIGTGAYVDQARQVDCWRQPQAWLIVWVVFATVLTAEISGGWHRQHFWRQLIID
jgi:hypothetical protein